jgi:hypothetical protein
MNIDYNDFSTAEPVDDPIAIAIAEQNHTGVLQTMAEETNTMAKDDRHPFRQLALYNNCDWEVCAKLSVFEATVVAIRRNLMTFSDVERDINFNLLNIWALAEELLPGKMFFTSQVRFDHITNLWHINIFLNVTEGTTLSIEEMEIKLLRIKTAEGIKRIY